MAKVFQVDTGGTLTTGLASYYKLEDETDFYGVDTLTNTNGVTFAASKVNNGADFGNPNTTKYLSVTTAWGNTGGAFSISVWFAPASAPATNVVYTFVACQDDTVNFIGWDLSYLDTSGTKSLRFGRNKINVAYQSVSETVTLTNGTPVHIVGTYDGTNLRLYRNNVLVAGPTAASGSGTDAGRIDVSSLGAQRYDTSSTQSYASCFDDECGIWNKALSTTEINDLYNNGNGQTMTEGGFSPKVIFF